MCEDEKVGIGVWRHSRGRRNQDEDVKGRRTRMSRLRPLVSKDQSPGAPPSSFLTPTPPWTELPPFPPNTKGPSPPPPVPVRGARERSSTQLQRIHHLPGLLSHLQMRKVKSVVFKLFFKVLWKLCSEEIVQEVLISKLESIEWAALSPPSPWRAPPRPTEQL